MKPLLRFLLLLVVTALLPAVERAPVEALGRAAAGAPVLHAGRIKPLETVARHVLLGLGSRPRPRDGGGASAWVVQGWMDHQAALDRQVVRLRHPELPAALGLPERRDLRYSLDEVWTALSERQELLESIQARAPRERSPVERQLEQLVEAVGAALIILDPIHGLELLPGPAADPEAWRPLGDLSKGLVEPDPRQQRVAVAWSELAAGLAAGNAATVERVVARLGAEVLNPQGQRRLGWELTYQALPWKSTAIAVLVLASLLAGAGLAWPRARGLRRAALLSAGLGLLPLVAGIGLRCAILSRMPVATLYESILFVAAVAILGGLLVELFRRDRLGVLTGTGVGCLLLLVSTAYSSDGDTLGVLQAVLDSNMWLGIHVLTITIGYGCCLVCAGVAHLALLRRIRQPGNQDQARADERLLVGLALVSLLFTLAGTILGGIWADQSWGRFWGWDPKENGALLIVLWLGLCLHLRLAGQCAGPGLALGLALLSIVVAMAWFGVNLLGVGLHSYGFDARAALGLGVFTALELIGAGVLWLLATRRHVVRQEQAA